MMRYLELMFSAIILSASLVFSASISGCRCENEPARPIAAAAKARETTVAQIPFEKPRPCPKCNVILITFDALRADHMGVYGYEKNTTPNMDAFAREAHVFTDAMSQAGTTVISLASLFTSKLPWTDEIYPRQGMLKLDEKETTLAQVMSGAGYDTAAVVTQRFTSSEFGYSKGFKVYDEDFKIPEPPELTLDRMFKALDALEKPFFLWVHFMTPHAPYKAKKEVFDEFYPHAAAEPTALESPMNTVIDYYSKREPLQDCYMEGIEQLPPSVIKQVAALYDGHIRMADDAFGAVMSKLKDMNLLNDTAVIVGADHAEMMGEHKYIGHNRLSWPSMHVPLMVRLPDKRHSMLSHPVMNLDIFPTILNLVGIGYSGAVRGRDLFDPAGTDYFQIAEYENGQAVKKDGYMSVEHHPDTYLDKGMEYLKALYDIRNDPHETKNLIGAEPVRAEELRGIARSLRKIEPSQGAADAGAPHTLEPESRTLEQLKKLGYIR